jgi:hypothetical protein
MHVCVLMIQILRMKRDEFLSTTPLAPFFFLDIECMVFFWKLYNLFELPLHREHRELIRESSRSISRAISWVFRCWEYRGQETLVFVLFVFSISLAQFDRKNSRISEFFQPQYANAVIL